MKSMLYVVSKHKKRRRNSCFPGHCNGTDAFAGQGLALILQARNSE